MSEQDLTNLIRAYADGELPADEQAAFTERLAREPELMQRVLHEQRLRAACAKSIKEQAPAPPADLKDRIAALAEAESEAEAAQPGQATPPVPPAQPSQGVQPDVVGRIGGVLRWVPLAAAAVLLLAAVAVYQAGDASDPTRAQITRIGLNDAQAELFALRHSRCSRDPGELHQDPDLPRRVDELHEAVATRFNAPVTGLDLSGIGYRFLKVGPCTIPGQQSLHLIYEATNPTDGQPHRISLWVMPTPGNSQLSPGKVHRVSLPGSDLPMVLWAHGGMNYYLVADTHLDAEAAAEALRNDAL